MAAIQIPVAAPAPLPAPASITPEERRKREEAVRFGHACVGLEGFKQTPASIALAQRFIDGEIDMDEFIALSTGGT
jgi:hypothetical protein